jgi:hypothetical protein
MYPPIRVIQAHGAANHAREGLNRPPLEAALSADLETDALNDPRHAYGHCM